MRIPVFRVFAKVVSTRTGCYINLFHTISIQFLYVIRYLIVLISYLVYK